MRALATIIALAGAAAIGACGAGGYREPHHSRAAGAAATGAGGAGGSRERDRVAQSGAAAKQPAWDPAGWRAPSLEALGTDSLASAIRRGHALVAATAESLPRFVGGNLNCTSCHL